MKTEAGDFMVANGICPGCGNPNCEGCSEDYPNYHQPGQSWIPADIKSDEKEKSVEDFLDQFELGRLLPLMEAMPDEAGNLRAHRAAHKRCPTCGHNKETQSFEPVGHALLCPDVPQPA